MELLKLLSTNLVVAQVVCFFLVLWLLKKFLWKPTLQVLDDRREKIATEFKTIEDTKHDVAKLKGEYQGHLAKIDEEAQARLRAVEIKGEEHAHEIREKARIEADRVIEDARKEIHFEFLKAKDTLKNDMVEMVIKTTEQMIQEKLTFDDDRKVIEAMLKELNKADEK